MKIDILQGDCLDVLKTLAPAGSIHCCVTSPPYFGLRDYKVDGQIGLEETPEKYVEKLVAVFREVKRVLRDDGTVWLNIGDSYNGYMANQRGTGLETKRQQSRKYIEPGAGLRFKGLKNKDLIGIPWRVAFALQADGWYLRSDIIWHKPNPMPESVTDRPTKSHEYVFLLTKSARYWYDADAVKETLQTAAHAPGNKKLDASRNDHDQMQKVWGNDGKRNKRSVWTIATKPYSGAHFATFPPKLVEPCILAGCPDKCCPECGAGWVRVVEKGPLAGEAKIQAGPRPHADATKRSPTSLLRTNGRTFRETTTTGWKPTCNCNRPDHIPGVTLDPFAGSGTTGMTAKYHGRNAVLIELNPEYIEIIRERCGFNDKQMELFA